MTAWIRARAWLFAALLLAAGMYAFLFLMLKQGILAHYPLDSYTLQARAWLKGELSLDRDYSYLELAYFRGRVFVSFPPVPTLAMLVLAPFFGGETPNCLVVAIYGVAAVAVAYALGRRAGLSGFNAAFWSFFLVFGSNLVECTVKGGVWYQAQALSFLLCCLGLLFLQSDSRRSRSLAFACLALAVGCRPLQLIYFPVFALIARERRKSSLLASGARDSIGSAFKDAVVSLWPFVMIGLCLAAYNAVRFGHPLEFGHRYLPEYARRGDPVFSLDYIGKNFPNIFRLPKVLDGPRIEFPRFNGMAFYAANPFFVSYFAALAVAAVGFVRRRRKADPLGIVIASCMLVHAVALLAHNTLGGWQFGLRYFIDLLPFAFYYAIRLRPRPGIADAVLALGAVALQLYGCLWLFLNWK